MEKPPPCEYFCTAIKAERSIQRRRGYFFPFSLCTERALTSDTEALLKIFSSFFIRACAWYVPNGFWQGAGGGGQGFRVGLAHSHSFPARASSRRKERRRREKTWRLAFSPPLPPRFSHLNSDKVFPSIWMRNFFVIHPVYYVRRNINFHFPRRRGPKSTILQKAHPPHFFVGIRLKEGCRVWMDPPRRRLFIFSFSFFVPTWWWSLHNLFPPVYSCLFLAHPAANFSCTKKDPSRTHLPFPSFSPFES